MINDKFIGSYNLLGNQNVKVGKAAHTDSYALGMQHYLPSIMDTFLSRLSHTLRQKMGT